MLNKYSMSLKISASLFNGMKKKKIEQLDQILNDVLHIISIQLVYIHSIVNLSRNQIFKVVTLKAF